MDENKFWLALNIYHEARNQPEKGQVAVGHVCVNRAIKSGESIKEIVLAPYQFSWLNNNKRPPIKNYSALYHSIYVAGLVIAERLQGKDLEGANHYHADYIDKPSWAENMKVIVKIGVHIFYKG